MSVRIRKQKRDNRFNINLTDDEAQIFEAASNITGINAGVIMRQMLLKQALAILLADDIEPDFSLDNFLNKGATAHLLRSGEVCQQNQ